MSTIVDIYLHGSVHLTNPGSEELFLGILTGSLPQPVGPTRGPADPPRFRMLQPGSACWAQICAPILASQFGIIWAPIWTPIRAPNVGLTFQLHLATELPQIVASNVGAKLERSIRGPNLNKKVGRDFEPTIWIPSFRPTFSSQFGIQI